MSTTFPTSQQTFQQVDPTDNMGEDNIHSTLHNDLASTVEAIEDRIGYTGDSDTATLTGLLSYKSRVLFAHYADAGNTSTTETDLYSDTIAANTLYANGQSLEAEFSGTCLNHATATRQLKVYFGGTAIFDSTALTYSTTTSGWKINVTIIRLDSDSVRCIVSMATTNTTPVAAAKYTQIDSLDFTGTNVLKITGTAAATGAATNDIVAKLGKVTWHAAPGG